MLTDLVTLGPDTPVLEGINNLLQAHIKGAPVVDAKHNYLGIFTELCSLKVLMTLCGGQSLSEYSRSDSNTSGGIMTKQLWMLQPEMDVFEAVNFLLSRRLSGAPVVDHEGRYLGTFSEKHSMDVLIGAIYDNLPTTQVQHYMDQDPNRIIGEHLNIHEVAQKFLKSTYRHLAVVRDGRTVGQISRQDLLKANQALVNKLIAGKTLYGQSWTAAAFMDRNAKTIDESMEMFSIVNIFRQTSHRRLPVLRGKQLVGQITRKNLLTAANELLNKSTAKVLKPLYLASVPDATPPSI